MSKFVNALTKAFVTIVGTLVAMLLLVVILVNAIVVALT